MVFLRCIRSISDSCLLRQDVWSQVSCSASPCYLNVSSRLVPRHCHFHFDNDYKPPDVLFQRGVVYGACDITDRYWNTRNC